MPCPLCRTVSTSVPSRLHFRFKVVSSGFRGASFLKLLDPCFGQGHCENVIGMTEVCLDGAMQSLF